MSTSTAEITAVRVVAYFPIDFPHASRHAAWPAAHLEHLSAARTVWRQPDATEDLALQAYGHEVLDTLLRSMPTAILEATGDDTLLAAAPSARDREALLRPAPGWTLTHARISLWNLGNALAVFTYDVPLREAPEPSALAVATRGHVYALAPAVGRLVGALTAWGDSEAVVLWGNPVYVLRVDPDVNVTDRLAIAAAVTTDGTDRTIQDLPSSVIRIGRHCSVVASSFDDPAADLLLRLAGVHQVCWAAALLYDARLGRELELISPDDPTLSVATLEQQADRILATYHLVRFFRLRYSSVEAHLDTGASRIWQALEENWKFPRVLSSLDDRLDFVRTFHQQLFARLQDSRSRVLNELVLVFTFLNLFSILLSALTFAGLTPLTLRTADGVAMGVALLANVLVYLYFRRRSTRGR